MKKILLILAVIGTFALTSCSGGYDGEKANELTEKIKSNSFSDSDVKALLGQYEACTKELYALLEKKDKGELTDQEKEKKTELLYARNAIECTLRDRDVEEMCPGTEQKVFDIYKKYSK